MTLAERLAAMEAEYAEIVNQAESLRRSAEDKTTALWEARRNASESQQVPRFKQVADKLATSIARMRDTADAAFERAGELLHQINEMQTHISQYEVPEKIAAILSEIAELESGQSTNSKPAPLANRSDSESSRKQLSDLRRQLLVTQGEILVEEYAAAAKQLVRSAATLRAFGEFAGIFDLRLELRAEELRIPRPRGELEIIGTLQSDDFTVQTVAVTAEKSRITSRLADALSGG